LSTGEGVSSSGFTIVRVCGHHDWTLSQRGDSRQSTTHTPRPTAVLPPTWPQR